MTYPEGQPLEKTYEWLYEDALAATERFERENRMLLQACAIYQNVIAHYGRKFEGVEGDRARKALTYFPKQIAKVQITYSRASVKTTYTRALQLQLRLPFQPKESTDLP